MKIDIPRLFENETIKSMPIIYVLNVVSAIESMDDTRTVVDNNQLKEEAINHV